MKKVYCTIGGSMNNVCHISSDLTIFPPNWMGNKRQDECHSIDDIKKFILETRTELVMFGIRASGIPNKAVKVSDTEKLEKVFEKYEKVIGKF